MSGPFAAVIAAADESDGHVSEARSDRHVQVPISHPRYEKKTRLTRNMTTTVSDSASEHNGRSPADLLTMRSEEVLHIRQGPVSHKETVNYQAFACYRQGSKKVHTQSVGYSSDGDLVLMRRDVAEVGGSGPNNLRRSYLGVDSAVCLNRNARPTDPQVAFDITGTKWERRMRTLKKYPGVKCPRSRKLQNRLNNDHFLSSATRKLHATAFEDSDPEGLHEPADPVFGPVPDELGWLLNTEEDLQRAELEKRGLNILGFSSVGGGGRAPKNPPKPVDSSTYRFMQLNSRFKSELQHAMTTDFMPGFIAEVEVLAEKLITDDASAPVDSPTAPSFDYACRDGYGRLITHAVAAYYRLNSKSVDGPDGQRITQVSLPKKRPMLPDQRLSAFLRGERVAAAKAVVAEPQSSASASDDEESAQNRLMARRRRFKKRVLRRRIDFYPPQSSAAAVAE